MSTALDQSLQADLAVMEKAGTLKTFRHITGPMDTEVTMTEKSGRVLVLSSNNYLGLADHPEVIAAGKAEYPIPMFVNCPQTGFGRERAAGRGVGQGSGPSPDAMDVWRAAAPNIDIISPDVYSPDFAGFCAKATRSGNPLFIPETGNGPTVGVRALYAFGRHDAMGFSPFGIDSMVGNSTDVFGYDLLSQLAPLILQHQGNGTMSAVLLGPDDPPQKIRVGNYTLEVAFFKPLPDRIGDKPACVLVHQRLPRISVFADRVRREPGAGGLGTDSH